MAPGLAIPIAHSANNTIPLSKDPEATITEIAPSPPDSIQSPEYDVTLLRDPGAITQEFDLLRFEAAAFDQLILTDYHPPIMTLHDQEAPRTTNSHDTPSTKSTSRLLISSPYNVPGHYLTLSSLPLPSILLALALTALQPTTPSYATQPYTTALNFTSVLHLLRHLCTKANHTWQRTSFYVVVFRSRLKVDADLQRLYDLDFESHREACESGGLLKYWFGKCDEERRNLATCFWHSREDAHDGGAGPWHKKARAAGRELYERIEFETYRFTIEDGAEEAGFEKWKD